VTGIVGIASDPSSVPLGLYSSRNTGVPALVSDPPLPTR
jgi:hypothetical protein